MVEKSRFGYEPEGSSGPPGKDKANGHAVKTATYPTEAVTPRLSKDTHLNADLQNIFSQISHEIGTEAASVFARSVEVVMQRFVAEELATSGLKLVEYSQKELRDLRTKIMVQLKQDYEFQLLLSKYDPSLERKLGAYVALAIGVALKQ